MTCLGPHWSAIGPRSVHVTAPTNALPRGGCGTWSAVVRNVPTLSHTNGELVGVEVGARVRGGADPRGPGTPGDDNSTRGGGDWGLRQRPLRPEGLAGQIIHNSLTSQNRCSERALSGVGT